MLSSCQQEEFGGTDETQHSNLKSYPSSSYWETLDYVTLPSGGPAVLTPWSSFSAIGTGIPVEIREDIKSKDGWVLFYDGINQSIGANNWIIFYNRFTGILKGFYFWPGSGQSNTSFWQLKFDRAHKLFNGVDHFTIPLSSTVTTTIPINSVVANITDNMVKGFETEAWNCFQTQLTYDPGQDLVNSKLNVYAHSSNITEFAFLGELESASSGSIVSTNSNSSNLLSNITDGVVTQTGTMAKDWLGKKKASGVIKTGLNIASGGVPELVKAGVNLLFGSFLGGGTTTTTSTLEFTTKGSIKIKGESTNPGTGSITPVSNIILDPQEKLGSWNLQTDPIVKVDQTAYAQTIEVFGSNNIYNYNQALEIDFSSINVVVNPQTLSMIKRYTVEPRIIYYGKFNGKTDWNDQNSSESDKGKGNLLYKDNDNEFYYNPSVSWNSDMPPMYNANPDPWEITPPPYDICSGQVKKKFVVKVTVTMYPKDEYGMTEIVSTKSFLPKYTTFNSSEKFGGGGLIWD